MFLARYAEKAGSGILDMIALCREAGLPAPEFHQSGGQFIQTLVRPVAQATLEVTGQVTGQVTEQVLQLLRAVEGELSRGQLQSALSLAARDHFLKSYLNPALAAGLVEMTFPDKPRSSRQKYRLTDKGLQLVADAGGTE